jgi:hypothetical protein
VDRGVGLAGAEPVERVDTGEERVDELRDGLHVAEGEQRWQREQACANALDSRVFELPVNVGVAHPDPGQVRWLRDGEHPCRHVHVLVADAVGDGRTVGRELEPHPVRQRLFGKRGVQIVVDTAAGGGDRPSPADLEPGLPQRFGRRLTRGDDRVDTEQHTPPLPDAGGGNWGFRDGRGFISTATNSCHMSQGYTVDYDLSDDDENVHHVWDNGIEPAVTVEPGEVVRFECRDAVDGQAGPDTTAEEFGNVSFDPVHPLTGPVAVEGAEPGDVLEVELLGFEHKGWGYTGFMPGEMGLGLLPEDFEDPGYHAWTLADGVAEFVNGIEVPVDPFPGTIGNAPAEDGEHDTLPPRDVGGNMDVKHVTNPPLKGWACRWTPVLAAPIERQANTRRSRSASPT